MSAVIIFFLILSVGSAAGAVLWQKRYERDFGMLTDWRLCSLAAYSRYLSLFDHSSGGEAVSEKCPAVSAYPWFLCVSVLVLSCYFL